MDNYYKIPMDFVRIFEPNIRNLSMYTEKESIEKNLKLILTTCPGESKYDPEFGCKIWDLDFERVVSQARWEGTFVEHIVEAIRKYEQRVSNVVPKVSFVDTKKDYEFSGATSVRKRADISIDATIISTGKRYCFFYSLYLGPLSSD
ncbi:MAG TPA: type VI secretion system baseplate protein TssE [Porphyromonadaceae bacterium]|nr:type VI secretion system baseplate protein TssE [Porphyromonadaceae bacterium]